MGFCTPLKQMDGKICPYRQCQSNHQQRIPQLDELTCHVNLNQTRFFRFCSSTFKDSAITQHSSISVAETVGRLRRPNFSYLTYLRKATTLEGYFIFPLTFFLINAFNSNKKQEFEFCWPISILFMTAAQGMLAGYGVAVVVPIPLPSHSPALFLQKTGDCTPSVLDTVTS